jgi:hypothetical protein
MRKRQGETFKGEYNKKTEYYINQQPSAKKRKQGRENEGIVNSLGYTVHHQIGTQREGGLKVRRTKSVVHGKVAVPFLGFGRHHCYVSDFQCWIGGRFQPDQLGPFPKGQQHRSITGATVSTAVTVLRRRLRCHVDKVKGDSHRGSDDPAKVALGAPVHVVHAQSVIAGAEAVQHGRRGGAAGRVRDAVQRSLRGRHGPLERAPRGIPRPRVLIPRPEAVRVAHGCGLTGRVLLEGRGEADRGNHSTGWVAAGGGGTIRCWCMQIGSASASVGV